MNKITLLCLFFGFFSCQRGNDEVERASLQSKVMKNPFETVLESFSNVAK